MSNFSEWLFGATREELVSYVAKEDERACRERAKWETKLRSEEERAEKAERWRDEVRERLRDAARRIHQANPFHEDDPDTCQHEECRLARAALGEQP